LTLKKNSVVWTCLDQIHFLFHSCYPVVSCFAPVHIFSLKMPKVTKTKAKLNQEYISEFGSEMFQTDGPVLRCIPCDSPAQTNQPSQVT
jgi:hypothetical protein